MRVFLSCRRSSILLQTYKPANKKGEEMLVQESLLGRVELKNLSKNKFGIPIPETMDPTQLQEQLYMEFIDFNTILITPCKKKEICRKEVYFSKTHSCFYIPGSILPVLWTELGNGHRKILFDVYRGREQHLLRDITFRPAVAKEASILSFSDVDYDDWLLDLKSITKEFPDSIIEFNLFTNVDCLIYKLVGGKH